MSWALTLSALGVLAFVLLTGRVQARKQAVDKRVAVMLTESERHLVLTEMRMLLVSVQMVLQKTAAGDYETAARLAHEAGLEQALKIGGEHPSILRKLPAPMKKLGFAVHRDFDRLSLSLKRDRPPLKDLVQAVTVSLSRCAACHSTYKITVEPGSRKKTAARLPNLRL